MEGLLSLKKTENQFKYLFSVMTNAKNIEIGSMSVEACYIIKDMYSYNDSAWRSLDNYT